MKDTRRKLRNSLTTEDREYYREALFFPGRRKPEAEQVVFPVGRACDKAGAEAIWAVAPSHTDWEGLSLTVFGRQPGEVW